jgi:hypothetical protein
MNHQRIYPENPTIEDRQAFIDNLIEKGVAKLERQEKPTRVPYTWKVELSPVKNSKGYKVPEKKIIPSKDIRYRYPQIIKGSWRRKEPAC